MKNIILCTKNKPLYDEFLEKIKAIDDEIKIVHVNKISKIMNVARSFCPSMIIIDGESFLDYKNVPKDLLSISDDKVLVIIHSSMSKKNNKKGLQCGYNLALNDLSSYGNLLAIKNNLLNVVTNKINKKEEKEVAPKDNSKEPALIKENLKKENNELTSEQISKPVSLGSSSNQGVPNVEDSKIKQSNSLNKKNDENIDKLSNNKEDTQAKKEIALNKTDIKDFKIEPEEPLVIDLLDKTIDIEATKPLANEANQKSNVPNDPILEELDIKASNLEIIEAVDTKSEEVHNIPLEELKAIENSFLELEELIAPVIKNVPKETSVEDFKKEALLDVEKSITELFSSIKDLGIPIKEDLISVIDNNDNTLKTIISKRNKRDDRGKTYESILEDLRVKKLESIPPKIFIQPEPKRYIPHWRKDAILTLFRIDKLKIKGFTQENIPKALRKIHDEEKRRFEMLKSINEAAVKTFDLSVSRVMIEPKSIKTDEVKLFNKTSNNSNITKQQVVEPVSRKTESLALNGIDFESDKIPEEILVKDTLNNIKTSISSYEKLSSNVQQKEKIEKFDQEEFSQKTTKEEEPSPVFAIEDVLKSEASFKKLSEEWEKKEKKVSFEKTEVEILEDEDLIQMPVFEDKVVEKISESSSKFNELNQSIKEKEIVKFDEAEKVAAVIQEEKSGPLSSSFEKDLEESTRRTMLITKFNEKDKFSKDKVKTKDTTDLFSDDHENLPDQSIDEELYFKNTNESLDEEILTSESQDETYQDTDELTTSEDNFVDSTESEDSEINDTAFEDNRSNFLNHPRFIKKEEESIDENSEESQNEEESFSFRRFQNDNKTSKSNQSDLLSYNGTIEDIFGTKNSELTPNQVSLMSKFNEKAKQKKREEIFAPKDFSTLRDEIVVEPPRHFAKVEEEIEPDKSKAKKKKKFFGFKK